MLNSLPIFYFTSQRCFHWWVQRNVKNHFNPKANKGGMQEGKHSGHKDMFKYISLRALDTHSYQGILTHPNFAANTPRLWWWKRVNCIFEFRRKQHTHIPVWIHYGIIQATEQKALQKTSLKTSTINHSNMS